jgi:hypothetical protein
VEIIAQTLSLQVDALKYTGILRFAPAPAWHAVVLRMSKTATVSVKVFAELIVDYYFQDVRPHYNVF